MKNLQKKFKSSLRFGLLILAAWGVFVLTLPHFFTGTDLASGEVHFTLPEGYSAHTESFSGKELLYHLDIINEKKGVYGHFQIIFMGTDLNLKEYLETADRFKSAEIDSLVSTGTDLGIIWRYTLKDTNAMQFFTAKKERLYTLALFGNKKDISMEDLEKEFQEILSTFVV